MDIQTTVKTPECKIIISCFLSFFVFVVRHNNKNTFSYILHIWLNVKSNVQYKIFIS